MSTFRDINGLSYSWIGDTFYCGSSTVPHTGTVYYPDDRHMISVSYKDGKAHCLDGPAAIRQDKGYEWWIHGQQYDGVEEWAAAIIEMQGKQKYIPEVYDLVRRTLARQTQNLI